MSARGGGVCIHERFGLGVGLVVWPFTTSSATVSIRWRAPVMELKRQLIMTLPSNHSLKSASGRCLLPNARKEEKTCRNPAAFCRTCVGVCNATATHGRLTASAVHHVPVRHHGQVETRPNRHSSTSVSSLSIHAAGTWPCPSGDRCPPRH